MSLAVQKQGVFFSATRRAVAPRAAARAVRVMAQLSQDELKKQVGGGNGPGGGAPAAGAVPSGDRRHSLLRGALLSVLIEQPLPQLIWSEHYTDRHNRYGNVGNVCPPHQLPRLPAAHRPCPLARTLPMFGPLARCDRCTAAALVAAMTGPDGATTTISLFLALLIMCRRPGRRWSM